METGTYSHNEDISTLSPDEPVFTSSAGGMFAGSQNFTVAGGTFNNITKKNYHAAPTVPPDFRMIPMGNIDLQEELMVNEASEVVSRRPARSCVRRVYSATTDGGNSKVTVAVYQGNSAGQHWRRDTKMYMSVRHPNIIQVWAGASYGNIHATVFHGDLVPPEVFLARHSPIMTVYLYVCYSEEWRQVNDYFKSLWQKDLYSSQCMMWIRSSTGRLSMDLIPPDTEFFLRTTAVVDGPASSVTDNSFRQAATTSAPPDTEVLAIESLALRQYHHICAVYLSQYRNGSIFTSTTVDIGAIISLPSENRAEEPVEITSLAKLSALYYDNWRISGHASDPSGNGWRRYRADGVFNTGIMLWASSYDHEVWLSQANHVFGRLQITSNLEDYVRIEDVSFTLTIGDARGVPPTGFLFLCPPKDFQTGPTSFRWPNRPAYWSLDSEGIKALSTEEATWLGFPPFRLRTEIRGRSWDDSVYAGLRKFHQAKGFDPDSQDVPRNLGHPLYELSRDVNSPFAHAEEITADHTLNSNGGPDGGHSLNGQIAPTEAPGVPAFGELQIVSQSSRFIMWIQLMLILFLLLSSLCEQVF